MNTVSIEKKSLYIAIFALVLSIAAIALIALQPKPQPPPQPSGSINLLNSVTVVGNNCTRIGTITVSNASVVTLHIESNATVVLDLYGQDRLLTRGFGTIFDVSAVVPPGTSEVWLCAAAPAQVRITAEVAS